MKIWDLVKLLVGLFLIIFCVILVIGGVVLFFEYFDTLIEYCKTELSPVLGFIASAAIITVAIIIMLVIVALFICL